MALRAAGTIHGGGPGLALLTEAVSVLEQSPAILERARALTFLSPPPAIHQACRSRPSPR
jgi:hypothetical protein